MKTRSTIIAAVLLISVYIPSQSQIIGSKEYFSTSGLISYALIEEGDERKGMNTIEKNYVIDTPASFDISVYKGDEGTLHVRVLGENKVDIALHIHDIEGKDISYEPVSVGGNGEIVYSLKNTTSGTCTVTANNINNKKEVVKKSINF